MKLLSRQKQSRFVQGFSLTEAAIVLGVIGLVVGAIWATAGVVRKRQPIQDTVQIVTDIATNVRGVYTGFPSATPPTDVDKQILAALYPASVVLPDKSNTFNAWGGTYYIHFNDPVGTGFSVEVSLPAALNVQERMEACLGLITRLSPTATEYTGALSGPFPSGAIKLDPVEGNAPSLALINDGGSWENATRSTVSAVTASTTSCLGVAFYFKL